jgi:hypothetical protein
VGVAWCGVVWRLLFVVGGGRNVVFFRMGRTKRKNARTHERTKEISFVFFPVLSTRKENRWAK